MKKHLLLVAVISTSVIFGCQKEKIQIEPTDNSPTIMESASTNQSTYKTYSEIETDLITDGFSQIPQPSGWLAEPSFSGYNSVYFWSKGTQLIEVYEWGNETQAAAGSGDECTNQWSSGGNGEGSGCWREGNDCMTDPDSLKVICCD